MLYFMETVSGSPLRANSDGMHLKARHAKLASSKPLEKRGAVEDDAVCILEYISFPTTVCSQGSGLRFVPFSELLSRIASAKTWR